MSSVKIFSSMPETDRLYKVCLSWCSFLLVQVDFIRKFVRLFRSWYNLGLWLIFQLTGLAENLILKEKNALL